MESIRFNRPSVPSMGNAYRRLARKPPKKPPRPRRREMIVDMPVLGACRDARSTSALLGSVTAQHTGGQIDNVPAVAAPHPSSTCALFSHHSVDRGYLGDLRAGGLLVVAEVAALPNYGGVLLGHGFKLGTCHHRAGLFRNHFLLDVRARNLRSVARFRNGLERQDYSLRVAGSCGLLLREL